MTADTLTIRHTVHEVGSTIYELDSTKNDASNATLPLPEMIKARLLAWKAQQEENRRLQPHDYIESDYISGKLILRNNIPKLTRGT